MENATPYLIVSRLYRIAGIISNSEKIGELSLIPPPVWKELAEALEDCDDITEDSFAKGE